ncbi:YlxR family protein [Brachybacterium sp. AOP25-B2-12]|uniref:YlxR family protein n=1 Tax=Brachybacterium sp. AOP25-B2-12 TaxID=3457710 RepID=UPI004033269C
MDPRIEVSGPERTCVGCRSKAPRDQLVRLVREGSPESGAPRLRADLRGSAPGRGAWVHPDARCLDLAVQRGGFARSFRGAIDATGLSELRDMFEAQSRPPRQKRVEPMDIR